MATSGTTTYSFTAMDVMQDALEEIGALAPGENIQGADIEVCRRKLNMLVKQWVSQADFAPGLKMWTRRTGYLFLQKDTVQYTLGPSGSNAAESYVTTTIGTTEASGQTTITLTSATGFAAAMVVGIELDTGSIQWTTVSSVSAPDIVIGVALTGQASAGNRVFAYTTASAVRSPFEITTAVLRDTAGNDRTMDPKLLVSEYEDIPQKSAYGEPSMLYFNPRRTNALVYIDCAPEDVTNVVRYVYSSYIEDIVTTGEDVDFPPHWFRALAAQLALDLCLPYEKATPPELKGKRDEALQIAQNAHPLRVTAFYESEPDCY